MAAFRVSSIKENHTHVSGPYLRSEVPSSPQARKSANAPLNISQECSSLAPPYSPLLAMCTLGTSNSDARPLTACAYVKSRQPQITRCLATTKAWKLGCAWCVTLKKVGSVPAVKPVSLKGRLPHSLPRKNSITAPQCITYLSTGVQRILNPESKIIGRENFSTCCRKRTAMRKPKSSPLKRVKW
jgi:hypothetical protein